MSTRRPAVAGSFYPRAPDQLREEIEHCFLHELGPGRLPDLGKEPSERKIVGVVCPHAGYTYSGPVASHAYFALSQQSPPDVVIVIGPNHYSFGSPVAIMSEGEWATPLGKVKIDKELTDRLVQSGLVDVDDDSHRNEHSVEVQLPFLQYIYRNPFRIVPISMGMQDLDISRSLGADLAHILQDKNALLIASSDLSHYIPQSAAQQMDGYVTDSLRKLDEGQLHGLVNAYRITTCGYGPMTAVLVASKILGATTSKLLSYQTSGDVSGDYSAVVGYCSVVISR